MLLEPGDVVAIRYATMRTSAADQYYRFGTYGEPDRSIDLDYYFWALRTDDSVVLVDSGFDPAALATRPGRECLVPPLEALAALGIERDSVSHVVVSHCHYDHIGNLSAFPEARFTMQRRELAFWSGPYAKEPACGASVQSDEIDFLTRAVGDGRVDLVDGDAQIAPDLRVALMLGHCPGQQVVEVTTSTGSVLLASDALHFYEEMDKNRPFHVFFDLIETYAGYDRFRRYSEQGVALVAGHDPSVMLRFPAVAGTEGLAVLLNPA